MLGSVLKDCSWRGKYFFLPVLEAVGEIMVRRQLVPSAAVMGNLVRPLSQLPGVTGIFGFLGL